MVYADYDYYANSYFGRAISEEDFPRFALRGSQYLDYITMGKVRKLAAVGLSEESAALEAVKMCCCALAEQYQSIDAAQALAQKNLSAAAADGAEVQSETVGGWSRSYRSGGDSAQAAVQAAAAGKDALLSIARQYLANTGLLYRGGRCCR